MPVPVIRRLPCRLAVLLLLATWFLLAASSARQTSTTFDEIFHIAGGYSYWTRNDYRIHPTNGNLIQRWIALPLLAGHYQFPSEDSSGWKRPVYHAFEVSQGFLYAPGNEPSEILYRCRLMVILLSIGLGFVVFLQSRRRFGRWGGLLSLILLCFCPTILAHGSLATSDLAAALFFLLAVDSIWSLLHRLTIGRLILSLFASAALFLVKFSAPLLLIMTAPMLLVRVASKRAYRICLPGRRTRVRGTATFGLFLALMLIHGIVIWSAIWAAFGFRYRAAGEADPELVFSDSWEFVLKLKSPLAPVMIELCRDNRLLPEAYLFGLAHTLRYSEARAAYLRGECGHTGWSHFFPYAFAVKTPLSLQALTLLMLWALIGAARLPSLRERTAVLFYQAVPLLSLLAVYWYSAVRSNLNLGIRHLLPVFPPLFILLGYLGRRAERQTGLALVIAVLLGWQVVDVVRIYPYFMAYFNQSIGGPDNGYKHLVDNSLDWGQDLPALRRWLDERGLNEPHQPVFYAYFGVGIPEREGVRIGDVEKDYLRPLLDQERGPLQSELTLCISATKWTGCNEPIPRWSLQEESRLRSLLEQLNQQKDGSVPSDTVDLAAYLLRVRVIATLRSRQPDELIAHSILVYRLSPEELRQAMHGPIPPEALPSGAKERNL